MHLPENHVRTVCKKGHGEQTCQFLTYLSGEAEWRCAKTGDPLVMVVLQSRRKDQAVVLKGNHCSGPPHFEPIDNVA